MSGKNHRIGGIMLGKNFRAIGALRQVSSMVTLIFARLGSSVGYASD